MNKMELLERVKVGLGNVPPHLDETISIYMMDILLDMIDSGVPITLIDLDNDSIDEKCVGAVVRGVSDTWNYGNGDTELSDYYYKRVDKLRGNKNG